MKKQETVEKNFQKVLSSWQSAKEKKVQNINKQIDIIDQKIISLQQTRNQLLKVQKEILSKEAPLPLSCSQREKQMNKDREQSLEKNLSDFSEIEPLTGDMKLF